MVAVPARRGRWTSPGCARPRGARTVIGTTGGQALEVTGQFSITLDELGAAHRETLPLLFG